MPTPTFHAQQCQHLLIHPSTFLTFAETSSAELHLMPPSAFTAVISVPPGQSSSSFAEVCTALLHLSQIQGTAGSLPKRWSSRLGMPKLTPAGIEPRNYRTGTGTLFIELPHPPSFNVFVRILDPSHVIFICHFLFLTTVLQYTVQNLQA